MHLLVPAPFDSSDLSFWEHIKAITAVLRQAPSAECGAADSQKLLWLAPFTAPASLTELAAKQIVLVLPTSGSTGSPKAVAHTAKSLRASIAATAKHLGGGLQAQGQGIWFLFLPPTHIAGVQVVARAVLSAEFLGSEFFVPTSHSSNEQVVPLTLAPPVGMENSFSAGAVHAQFAAWQAKLSALPAAQAGKLAQLPRFTSLVPTQLHRLFAAVEAGDELLLKHLRSFKTILVGGAKVPAELLLKAKELGINLTATYGSSETAGGLVYDGRALEGVKLALNQAGQLRLKSSSLAAGYVDLAGELQPLSDDGWFTTSDLARIAESQGGVQQLSILGRSDDVIISGGKKILPAQVEEILEALPEVSAATVLGIADPHWGQVVAAAVVPAKANASASNVLSALKNRAVPGYLIPKVLLPLTQLPLLSNNKVDRQRLKAMLEQAFEQLTAKE